MDPPPAPPPQPPPSAQPLSSTPATATTAAYTSTNTAVVAPTTYPDSIDSSPRSRTTDSYFEDPPPPLSSSSSSKLRLMCSYGGHIVPRPHDKSLCYVGGDTRIVVVDRHTSLSSLCQRLANSLLNGRPFILKYQLPSEDLDSLITVSTDEDFDNMIDEYDRTNNNSINNNNVHSSKSPRLRLFLFPLKPETSHSIGPILESSFKTEDWFLNALNGDGTGLLNRRFSDSATSVNRLLGLDDDVINENNNNKLNKNAKQQEVHSVPDSPMLETTSSFGSTSSSPSLANLPPIKVHVDDGGAGARGVLPDQKGVVGIEEQFAQINVAGSGGGGGVGGQKQEEVFMVAAPPIPVSIAVSGVPGGSQGVIGEYQNRGFSDDERSDHGNPPPQAQPQNLPPLTQQKSSVGSSGGAVDAPSPDSVSSDHSLSNAINRQKPVVYQEPVMQIPSGANRVVANPMDPKINVSDANTRGVQIQQQVQDSGYVLQPQLDQQLQQQQPQQFIPAAAHYIPHHPAGAVPISFYPVYAPQQQHHHQLDQQYPLYYVQARQRQAYGLPVQQSGISETTTTIPSTLPQTSPNPAMVPPSAAYSALRNAPVTKPEMAPAGMYRTTTTGMPQLVQVPPSQHQQQYVGYSQIHNPSQSVAPPSTGTANYAYELAETAHAQVYYGQPLAATTPSQYQTTTAAAGGALPDASASVPTENIKQQIRTSQPL
uniref:PB1 domain-containing protein n=1 Tax=Rhizophora mucronata TaxID=61149 RepID=A0A2P2K7M1_RHIMU